MNKIGMAVNHDRNIERIVELGLARRDLEIDAEQKCTSSTEKNNVNDFGFKKPPEKNGSGGDPANPAAAPTGGESHDSRPEASNVMS